MPHPRRSPRSCPRPSDPSRCASLESKPRTSRRSLRRLPSRRSPRDGDLRRTDTHDSVSPSAGRDSKPLGPRLGQTGRHFTSAARSRRPCQSRRLSGVRGLTGKSRASTKASVRGRAPPRSSRVACLLATGGPRRQRELLQPRPKRFWGRSVVHTPAALSASSTRASRNGTRRRRTPVASKIALATAAPVGRHAASPAP